MGIFSTLFSKKQAESQDVTAKQPSTLETYFQRFRKNIIGIENLITVCIIRNTAHQVSATSEEKVF